MPCSDGGYGLCNDSLGGSLEISQGEVFISFGTGLPGWAAVPRPQVAAIGDLFAYGGNACIGEQSGVTCWSGTTGHGFKVSDTNLINW